MIFLKRSGCSGSCSQKQEMLQGDMLPYIGGLEIRQFKTVDSLNHNDLNIVNFSLS